MCLIRPKNKEEMLTVSGVGEFKYAKYGERFLKVLRTKQIPFPDKNRLTNCGKPTIIVGY